MGPRGCGQLSTPKGCRMSPRSPTTQKVDCGLPQAGVSNHRGDGVYLISKPGARPRPVISGVDDPLGLLWYEGSLYVSSVGRVSVYSHFNGRHFTRH